jgi:cell division protein FtsQ
VYLRYKLACMLLVALGSYGLWLALLRELPIFQVQSVSISGLSGDSAPQIASTLELTSREMTTTDFSTARLRSAVSAFQSVASLRVDTQFPHGVHIDVAQRTPLARLDYDGTIVAVAANDHVLGGLVPSRELPLLRSTQAPVGDRLTNSLTREELALLAAAPAPLRRRVYSMRLGREGLTAALRDGPLIYFGDATLPHAKWDSAAAVLANPSSNGARYVDVSLPGRPAAAVGDPQTSAATDTGQASTSVATLVGAGSNAVSSSTSG